ncbi:MAG: hypothetical protein WCY49_07315 [Anaerovoracaceae bacterium]
MSDIKTLLERIETEGVETVGANNLTKKSSEEVHINTQDSAAIEESLKEIFKSLKWK